MRVFVTVGNALQPFDRMLTAVDTALRAHEVHGTCQFGTSSIRPHALRGVAILPRGGFEEEVDRADIVISHAGVGSLHTAMLHGHVPIVFARRARLGEHVNDHQVELADALGAQRRVVVADDAASLLVHIRAFLHGDLKRRPANLAGSGRVLSLFADALHGVTPRATVHRRIARVLAGLAPPLERLQRPTPWRSGFKPKSL